eukprot:s75_g7.t1
MIRREGGVANLFTSCDSTDPMVASCGSSTIILCIALARALGPTIRAPPELQALQRTAEERLGRYDRVTWSSERLEHGHF